MILQTYIFLIITENMSYISFELEYDPDDSTSLCFKSKTLKKERTHAELLKLSLPVFYTLVERYKGRYNEFTLYISTNEEYDRFGEILYELYDNHTEEECRIGENTNKLTLGKYFLVIDIERN